LNDGWSIVNGQKKRCEVWREAIVVP